MLDPHDPSDKRPKLERARSAAEKENLPMQRSGSVLRRQYSQQDPPTRRMSESGGDVNPNQRRIHSQQQYQQQGQMPAGGHHQIHQAHVHSSIHQQGSGGVVGGSGVSGSVVGYPDDDPRFYQVITKTIL